MIVFYIVGGIIVLFLGLQFSMVLSAKRSKGLKVSGLKGTLRQIEKKGSSGIVYFHSPSCHACKIQTPIIKSLQKKYDNVFDVDISKDYSSARIFGVKATPTTVFVKDGIIQNVQLGAKPDHVIEKLLQNI